MDTPPDVERARIPVACTLDPNSADHRKLEWAELRDSATAIVSLEAGVRLTFPVSMADDIEDLARRERTCCSFLSITTSVRDETLTLEITTSDPDALPVISTIAGAGSI